MNRRHIAGNFLLSHTHHQSVPRTSTSCHAPLSPSPFFVVWWCKFSMGWTEDDVHVDFETDDEDDDDVSSVSCVKNFSITW